MINSEAANPSMHALHEVAPLSPRTRRQLEDGLNTKVYAPFLEAMIGHGATLVKTGQADPDTTPRALGG